MRLDSSNVTFACSKSAKCEKALLYVGIITLPYASACPSATSFFFLLSLDRGNIKNEEISHHFHGRRN